MWIFALYVLLRTWKQRIRKLKTWKKNGALAEMLKRVEDDRHNVAALMRARHIQWVKEDEDAIESLTAAEAAMQNVYDMTAAIRMNLAKHEVKGKPNRVVRAPGCGRINGWCGALDYEMDLGDGGFYYINRRDIADSLRGVENKTERES
jgi:hypothetical protein